MNRKVFEDDLKGLNSKQVEERMEKGLHNVAIDSAEKTISKIVKDNVLTYFNIIFFVLSILVCMAGSLRSLTFLPIVIGNTLIGIIQEIRARDVLKKISILNKPHATVVRHGNTEKIPSDKLVEDDIVIFHGGEQIPADAVVVSGQVQVNEALLTGEADEILKEEGMELLSGSFVVSGECYAKLQKVGKESYISKLTLEAKKMKDGEQSEMIRSINNLVKWVGVAIIPIGCILFYQGYFVNQETFRESVVSMVAAVIGMIPEGLYLLTTVALAISTIRLAQKKVLLHDMKSIESLARVDILCVDKTGTITENEITVSGVIETREYQNSKTICGSLNQLIGDFVSNMTPDNMTMKSMKEYFTQNTGRHATQITSFSSNVKYCSVTFEQETFVLGAPDVILQDDYVNYRDVMNQYIKEGYRILVFGKYLGETDGKILREKTMPYGFVLLTNALRHNAVETFRYFSEQRVAIKVISGDNPETVSEVAKRAGIDGADNYIDARELRTVDDVKNAVSKYTVFGRVTPKQKRQIVMELKGQGHTVAMTGDGVNDILAMKEADCSIAMASGSEATAQIAQLVLLESDFSCMPSVVLEGRRVVNNVQRSASLFLVKNMFSFFMSIFSAIFMITYPLEPAQISLISMFTIGIPGFLLALETNENRIEGKFLKNVFVKALPAGITDFLAVATLVICGNIFKLPSADIATAATMLLAIVGFMILARISKPLNKFRIAILSANVAALLLCGIFLNELFALEGMTSICILLFVVLSFASESVFRMLSTLVDPIREGSNIKQKH